MSKPPIGQAPGKRAHVEAMFDEIAPRYDLLNRVLSFGIDVWWRKRAVALLRAGLDGPPRRLLDVATGTADLAIEALSLGGEVVGVDISEGMLAGGRAKLRRRGLERRVTLVQGDAADLPFDDDAFDGALVAFGVRNFEDLGAGLRGMRRVLRPGAPLVVLEFGHPTAPGVRQGYPRVLEARPAARRRGGLGVVGGVRVPAGVGRRVPRRRGVPGRDARRRLPRHARAPAHVRDREPVPRDGVGVSGSVGQWVSGSVKVAAPPTPCQGRGGALPRSCPPPPSHSARRPGPLIFH